MSSNNPNKDIRTPEEFNALTRALKSKGGHWVGRRDYETRTRERIFSQLDDVYKAVVENTNADQQLAEDAWKSSKEFADLAFRSYEVANPADLYGGPFDSVFAVPMRMDGKTDAFQDDTRDCFPLLTREFGVTPEIQQYGTLGLPPCVIETKTQSSAPGDRGAAIIVPLYSTMEEDLWPDKQNMKQLDNLTNIGTRAMRQAAEFAHIKLGAKILGLGAMLPKLSGYGASFIYHPDYDMSNLVTTTGHGGTVFLVLETIKELQKTGTMKNKNVKLGVVGAAGSIGWSTIESTLELVGEFEMYTNDQRSGDLKEKIGSFEHGRLLHQVNSPLEVLQNSDIIVSAVTRPIDLDVLDPDKNLDMRGKVIVDDSEPKSFDWKQVEERGGHAIRVVGKANDEFKALKGDGRWSGGPENPFNFGHEAGLYDGGAWGCDTEVVVLSWAGAYKEAISGEVTKHNVRNIGRLCLEAGVGVAPFQTAGRPVRIV